MPFSKSNAGNILVRYSLCMGLGTLLGPFTTAFAQHWEFEPVLEIAADYNDNIFLNRDDDVQIDGTAFIVDANGRFVRRGPTSEIRLAPRIRYRTYTNNSIEDTDDLFFDFFANKDLRRGSYGLQARFAQEDVLTAEIDDPDFDNPDVNSPVNLDTGRIQAGIERESIILAPYLEHEWTETLGFGLDASYVDVSYEENQLNLTDYTSASLGARITYRTSERSVWSVRLFGNDYDADTGTDNTRSDSQSIGASLELRHQFSQTLEGRISVGYEDIDSDTTLAGVTVSESDVATLFSAGLTKTGEISRVVFDVSQSVDPSGGSSLQERTQLRLRYTRQLSPKIYGSLEVRVQTTEDLSPQSIERTDRDFQWYRAGLEWRLSQKWSLRGDYTFTTQDFSNEIADASSNAVSISFVYQPARIR